MNPLSIEKDTNSIKVNQCTYDALGSMFDEFAISIGDNSEKIMGKQQLRNYIIACGAGYVLYM